MHVYEVHVIKPRSKSTKHTDIREAVREYLNHPDTKLRINIDGLVITMDEIMSATFHGFELEGQDDQTAGITPDTRSGGALSQER